MSQTSGSRTYPAGYGFDAQGRTKTLTTWTNFPCPRGGDDVELRHEPGLAQFQEVGLHPGRNHDILGLQRRRTGIERIVFGRPARRDVGHPTATTLWDGGRISPL